MKAKLIAALMLTAGCLWFAAQRRLPPDRLPQLVNERMKYDRWNVRPTIADFLHHYLRYEFDLYYDTPWGWEEFGGITGENGIITCSVDISKPPRPDGIPNMVGPFIAGSFDLRLQYEGKSIAPAFFELRLKPQPVLEQTCSRNKSGDPEVETLLATQKGDTSSIVHGDLDTTATRSAEGDLRLTYRAAWPPKFARVTPYRDWTPKERENSRNWYAFWRFVEAFLLKKGCTVLYPAGELNDVSHSAQEYSQIGLVSKKRVYRGYGGHEYPDFVAFMHHGWVAEYDPPLVCSTPSFTGERRLYEAIDTSNFIRIKIDPRVIRRIRELLKKDLKLPKLEEVLRGLEEPRK